MKERPILFSAPMVKAILSGQKTQTRRIMKLPHGFSPGWQWDKDSPWTLWDGIEKGKTQEIKCPYGQPGDQLWVKETHAFISIYGVELPAKEAETRQHKTTTIFKADPEPYKYFTGQMVADFSEGNPGRMVDEYREKIQFNWRPSIFMPRWASRIQLEVTGVRVERLNDISIPDAIAEGIRCPLCGYTIKDVQEQMDHRLCSAKGGDETAIDEYRELWESINGPGSWQLNPWVWVVEFKRLNG